MVLRADEETEEPSQQGAEPDYVEMKGIRLTGTPLYLDMQVGLSLQLPHLHTRLVHACVK